MRNLPPFSELVAFEAVSRHLSFTRAAAELCVTQSAVSHRVKRLEEYFGAQLIKRLNPGIALTDAGAALLPELTTTLDRLSRLGGGRERRLRVAAGAPLCTWWLAGKLSNFMAQRPGVSVELIPIDNVDSTVPEVDVRILWVAEGENRPSATQAPLFSEQVFPVCSPKLLPDNAPLAERQALGDYTLLHKAADGAGEWSWEVWLNYLGIESSKREGGELRFADMGLVLSAAVNGAGVGLVRSLLAHDALKAGSLILPITDFEPMTSSKKHIARWRANDKDDPDIRAFVSWLIAQAGATLAETDAMVRTSADVSLKNQ